MKEKKGVEDEKGTEEEKEMDEEKEIDGEKEVEELSGALQRASVESAAGDESPGSKQSLSHA